MMLFHGFKSKKELLARIKDTTQAPLPAGDHFEETSFFGAELKDNGTFCVCMDHPKRTKFANITVKDGFITGVK